MSRAEFSSMPEIRLVMKSTPCLLSRQSPIQKRKSLFSWE